MSEWVIKKGNTSIQDIPVYDRDDALVTNLAAASEIKFHIKASEAGAPLVERTVGSGIEVNTPTTGYLRITLTATNTNLPPKKYYMGLQIKWTSEVREVILKIDGIETETLRITQDIVNATGP